MTLTDNYGMMGASELDYISIKGFKGIASIEKLKIQPINIIIGPNGSGKSNFIGIFSFLHAIREGRLVDYVAKAGGADKVLHFGTKVTKRISIHISFNNEVNQYEITLEPGAGDELIPTEETASFWDKRKHNQAYVTVLSKVGKEAGISSALTKGTTESWVRERLGRWKVFHFHDTSPTSAMKMTSDINDNQFLRPDGSNLSAFLCFLAAREPATYELIRKTIQRMAPFFDNFILVPSRLNPDKIRLEWTHKNSDKYFDASAFSDGTLRFIALATLLLQPKKYRPSIILIDEPELGLHPAAITLLASLIKMASRETQVIVSTQSSLLIDHFDPENILVADRIDGGMALKRLDSDALDSWLEEYSLGQLWEKNEIGGRPRG